MTQALDNILGTALSLPAKERAELATRLIRSLDGPVSTPDEQAAIDSAWDAEIARRLQEIEDGTAELIDGDEAFASIRAKLDAFRKARAT